MARKRNTAKRKNKVFAEVVRAMTKDSLLTLEELTVNQDQSEFKKDEQGRILVEKCELPELTTAVDTLNGTFIYSDERLSRHIETMKLVLKEFDDGYFVLADGKSICHLRRDKKGRIWADDQTILHMCYTAIAMNLAMWTYRRIEWAALPEGMPWIRFNFDRNETSSVQEVNHEQTAN